jgi:hypothetical protein
MTWRLFYLLIHSTAQHPIFLTRWPGKLCRAYGLVDGLGWLADEEALP